jgi:hypothetical protein
MVQEGHAWSNRYKYDRGPYVADERMAKALSRGFNRDGGAVMPKDFRREHGPCTPGELGSPSGVSPRRRLAAPAVRLPQHRSGGCTPRPLPATAARTARRLPCAEATYFLK